MHPPGNGRLGNTEDGRSLGMSHLLADDEYDCLPINRLQLRDPALEPNRVIQVASVYGRSQSGKHRELVGQAPERPPPAAKITAGIESNSAQPSREFGVTAETTDFLNEYAAHVLGDILGIGARTGQLPRQPVNPVIMPAQERFERVAVASNRGGNEVSIWIVADVRPHAFRIAPEPISGAHGRSST